MSELKEKQETFNDTSGLRPRLSGEKLSRVDRSLAYTRYPGRANVSYISLQNLANRLHEKQKVGSAGRVTRLAESPFFDGRVTLLAGPTFLHRLAYVSVKARQSEHARALLARSKGSTLLSHVNAR